jgi:hypothetical protein
MKLLFGGLLFGRSFFLLFVYRGKGNGPLGLGNGGFRM